MAAESNKEKEAKERKSVLCCFGKHRRSIKFEGMNELKEGVKEIFKDYLPKDCDIFFQLKNEQWSGEFTDVTDESEIIDKSVLRVVVEGQEVN